MPTGDVPKCPGCGAYVHNRGHFLTCPKRPMDLDPSVVTMKEILNKMKDQEVKPGTGVAFEADPELPETLLTEETIVVNPGAGTEDLVGGDDSGPRLIFPGLEYGAQSNLVGGCVKGVDTYYYQTIPNANIVFTASGNSVIGSTIDYNTITIKPTQEQKLVIHAPAPIEYKFKEGELLEELRQYINKTYTAHYGNSKYQATDMIMDAGHGTGFCIGSIMKYAKRYGKKSGYNRKDLLKIIHYAMIELYIHDLEKKGDNTEE